MARFEKEATWRESTRKRNVYALTFFERIGNVPIQAINADVTRAAREFVERTQGPASANRIMSIMRSVLRSCVRWEWTTHVPPIAFPKVAERDPVWIQPDRFPDLLRELPEHLRAPAIFSVLTGLRAANTRNLDWSQVDLEEGHVTIPASQYKTNRVQRFPLSTNAVTLLSSLPNRSGRVFLYKGNPITGAFSTKAFRKAAKRAGLEGLRWHDLRHTFASWVAQSGASDRVLQALGGWTSPKMVARYAHLKPSDLRPHVEFADTFAVTVKASSPSKDAKKPVKMVPETRFELATHALRKHRATK